MSRRTRLLRPAGFDELGLRRALGDRSAPFLVGAMAFLAALALGGEAGASALAARWGRGASGTATVQVPRPGAPAVDAAENRQEAVLNALRSAPGVVSARPLSDDELSELLRPWLGAGVQDMALPLPAVLDVRLDGSAPAALRSLAARAAAVAPGTLVEGHALWTSRLTALADSLRACAGVALAVVAGVAAAVVAGGVRAGLAARRASIEIVHGLGAPDGWIAGRFAGRAATLAAAGGLGGALAALPALVGMASLAAPFVADGSQAPDGLAALPPALWLVAPGLPAAAGAIGWVTAQITVRRWLRRLA